MDEPNIEIPNELEFNEDGTQKKNNLHMKKISDYIVSFAFFYSSFLCFDKSKIYGNSNRLFSNNIIGMRYIFIYSSI